MSIIVDNIEYENLFEYVATSRIYISLNSKFPQKEIQKTIKERNYQGVFVDTLTDPKTNQKRYYEYVCVGTYIQNNEEILILSPIRLPDLDILNTYSYDNKEPEYEGELLISFEAHVEEYYKQIKENQIMDFDGYVSELKPEDTYVVDDGVKYKVLKEMVERNKEMIGFKLEHDMIPRDLMQNMKKDNYMGLFERNITYNTGQRSKEIYTISDIDDEYIYFQDYETLSAFKDIVPDNITTKVNSLVFSYRSDWIFW